MQLKRHHVPNVQDAIDNAISELAGFSADTKEYEAVLDKIERLHKMQTENTKSTRVDRNTIVMAAANLLGIGLIVLTEKDHVITSKALGFVGKLR